MFSSLLSSGKKTTLEKNVCNSTAFQACSGPLQHFTVKKFAIGNEANHALRRVCKIRCQPTMRMEEKPKRVAIAGAGIAGLSAALALLNTPSTGVEEITLYEPRTTTDFGQGAALNINGAAAILLGCYNVPLWKIANPMEKVVAKTVFGGNVFTVDVGEAVKASPEAQKALVVDGRPTFMTVMRDQFQQQLIDAIEQKVTFCRGDKYAVQDVQSSSSGSSLVLEDGSSTDEYDLVIGADGIRSQLRGYVAGQLKPPSYTRLRVQWAVAPRGSSSLPTGIIEQWFGDGCYTLRYAAGPESSPTEMLAISFYDKSQVSENVGYDKADLKQEVKRRLEKAKMPEQVMKVFHRAERFIETGVYEHDILKSWSRDGNCTLIGDAAHAMPPHLGQGANQAVQDAHALALSIAGIGGEHESLSDALDHYEKVRKIPVSAILRSSKAVGMLETQGGPIGMTIRNNLFRMLGAVHGVERAFLSAAIPRFD